MKPNELAAAVERLRRDKAGDSSAYGEFTLPCTRRLDDRRTVADAYLAREADDAKPVDRGWLVSVLGREPDRSIDSPACKRETWDTRGASIAWDIITGLCICRLGTEWKDLDNRGDVRALMRLARWPANETTPGGGDAEK